MSSQVQTACLGDEDVASADGGGQLVYATNTGQQNLMPLQHDALALLRSAKYLWEVQHSKKVDVDPNGVVEYSSTGGMPLKISASRSLVNMYGHCRTHSMTEYAAGIKHRC